MKELDVKSAIKILNTIMEYELAGVVRYTHYSLMVTGPYRIPLVDFFKAQASESLTHAQQAGEIITGLDGGHPSLKIAPIKESYHHATEDIIQESLEHEQKAVSLYKELLKVVKDASVYLEEYTRTMIGNEEMHSLELRKMLRDYSIAPAASAKKSK
jgi:bacterioferritin